MNNIYSESNPTVTNRQAVDDVIRLVAKLALITTEIAKESEGLLPLIVQHPGNFDGRDQAVVMRAVKHMVEAETILVRNVRLMAEHLSRTALRAEYPLRNC